MASEKKQKAAAKKAEPAAAASPKVAVVNAANQTVREIQLSPGACSPPPPPWVVAAVQPANLYQPEPPHLHSAAIRATRPLPCSGHWKARKRIL